MRAAAAAVRGKREGGYIYRRGGPNLGKGAPGGGVAGRDSGGDPVSGTETTGGGAGPSAGPLAQSARGRISFFLKFRGKQFVEK